jgi:hypothetical protein
MNAEAIIDREASGERERRRQAVARIRYAIDREQANGIAFGPMHRTYLLERAPEQLRRILEKHQRMAILHPELVGARTTFAGADPAGMPSASFAAVANTLTETNLWQPIAKFSPIPAGELQPGRIWECEFGGVIGTTATPTITFKPYMGTSVTPGSNTALGAGNALTLATVASTGFYSRFVFGCRKIGVSTAITEITGNGFAILQNLAHGYGSTIVTNIDDTIAQGFMVTATWGTASASNTITCQWISFRSQN